VNGAIVLVSMVFRSDDAFDAKAWKLFTTLPISTELVPFGSLELIQSLSEREGVDSWCWRPVILKCEFCVRLK
jgi:hypothetical protein